MKQNLLKLSALLLIFTLVLSIISCEKNEPTDLWQNAIYTEDTTVGTGNKTITVEITTEEKSITITLKTDKENLGDALFEEGLINDPAFFDTVNGIYADYSEYQTYWAFYVSDTYSTAGVNDTPISGGENFKLVYSFWG